MNPEIYRLHRAITLAELAGFPHLAEAFSKLLEKMLADELTP